MITDWAMHVDTRLNTQSKLISSFYKKKEKKRKEPEYNAQAIGSFQVAKVWGLRLENSCS